MKVTNNSRRFHWREYGLNLNIQAGSLPAGIKMCVIQIKTSLAGEYQFPDNKHLVSAVYWFCCEPRCKFMQPISVEIQHCAKPDNTSKLSFVKASCAQQNLPYTFRQLHISGCFNSYTSYGSIELNSFSGVGIAQEDSEERVYVARQFYFHSSISTYNVDLVVTWNIEAHRTVSSSFLSLMHIYVPCVYTCREYGKNTVTISRLSRVVNSHLNLNLVR